VTFLKLLFTSLFPIYDGSDVGNLVGFRQHHGGQQEALTKGIAGSILNSVARPVKKTLVSAPFATDEALPTDPYASVHGGRSMSFLENYRGGGSIPAAGGLGLGRARRRSEPFFSL